MTSFKQFLAESSTRGRGTFALRWREPIIGKWEEGTTLPWKDVESIHADINASRPVDISSLSTWFVKKLRGGQHAQIEIEDVESSMKGESLIVTFTYIFRDDLKGGYRKSTIEIVNDN